MSGTSTPPNTLAASQSLKYGETLVSVGGIIEVCCGWQTEINLLRTQEVLKLDEKGTLKHLNDRNTTIWSSNISSKAVSNPIAHPLDTGNSVIRNGLETKDDGVLWQSFDYSGDSLMPGMKLGWNGDWSRKIFIILEKCDHSPDYVTKSYPGHNLYCTTQTRTLQVVPAGDEDQCENYAFCGANSICSSDGSRAYCECLRGYVPMLPGQWNMAVLFDDIREGGNGCLFWLNTLTDMRKFSQWGQDLYIRVPPSELGTRRKLYGKCYKTRQRKQDAEMPTFDLRLIMRATKTKRQARYVISGVNVNGDKLLPHPKVPGFYTEIDVTSEANSSSENHKQVSINELSIIVIDAR
ncbi:hypothetical protein Fmac_021247 [Flemingia macrophylla]|uniref:EGF-like domain-containing protein n=1 Tax=Flemingia macrophylla TaxID=520843 RepID=A0ABD1LWC8_9FABA